MAYKTLHNTILEVAGRNLQEAGLKSVAADLKQFSKDSSSMDTKDGLKAAKAIESNDPEKIAKAFDELDINVVDIAMEMIQDEDPKFAKKIDNLMDEGLEEAVKIKPGEKKKVTVKFPSFAQAKTAHESMSDRTARKVEPAPLSSMDQDNQFEVTITSQEGLMTLTRIVKNYRGSINEGVEEDGEDLSEAKGLNWPGEVQSDFRDAIRNYEYASDVIDFLKSKQKTGSKEHKWIESNRDEIINNALQYGLKEDVNFSEAKDDEGKNNKKKKKPDDVKDKIDVSPELDNDRAVHENIVDFTMGKKKGSKWKVVDQMAKKKKGLEKYAGKVGEVVSTDSQKGTVRLKIDGKEVDLEAAMLDPIKEEVLDEKELTDAEEAKKEEIVKKLKEKKDEFKKKYGDRWESVMYATATKMAKKQAESVNEANNPDKGRLKSLMGRNVKVVDGPHKGKKGFVMDVTTKGTDIVVSLKTDKGKLDVDPEDVMKTESVNEADDKERYNKVFRAVAKHLDLDPDKIDQEDKDTKKKFFDTVDKCWDSKSDKVPDGCPVSIDEDRFSGESPEEREKRIQRAAASSKKKAAQTKSRRKKAGLPTKVRKDAGKSKKTRSGPMGGFD